MTLNDVVFAFAAIIFIAFGSAFFSEWAEKHTKSFTMEIFSIIGFPTILWCVSLIVYNVLQKTGILV